MQSSHHSVLWLILDDALLPLELGEGIACLRNCRQPSYAMHLVVCRQSLYLQVIWAHLSSNLYVLDQQAYCNHLGEAL
ncbi:hypothetical protein PMIT1313_00953 [Prochlorococcus marinus str. MIT 1313]|uniref:hypothetical protein n=1 Tax=Prochlorococcus TaxID=1218 RepID=UPI0007BB29AD|nr:hypothetical protein [Prochlorococcus marinus]KZR69845.1 hypothetical protein PMIT1313_00953 [Prochlorococcus marinus str. MIT 1313]KZR72192.1 hypothetical protein PMIT1318_01251 [Prochlorococcus marinus str. MIT 1318]